MFNWSDIRVFLELARQRHLTLAATRLRVDTSTVSRRIAELERVIECKLFERSQGGFILSEGGMKLLPLAEKMETLGNEILATVALSPDNEVSVVRVATMEGLATEMIARSLELLRAEQPNLILELLVVQQPTNLGKREADISISMMKLDSPRLISEKVGGFDIYLYAAKEYLDRFGIPENEVDLQNHCFIDYLEPFIPVSEVRWLRELIPNPQIVFSSNSLIAQKNAAMGGVGLVALPDYLASPDTGLVVVMPAKKARRDLWLTVHSDTEYFSKIRIVSNFMRREISQLPNF